MAKHCHFFKGMVCVLLSSTFSFHFQIFYNFANFGECKIKYCAIMHEAYASFKQSLDFLVSTHFFFTTFIARLFSPNHSCYCI